MEDIKPPPLATSAAADSGAADLDIVIISDGGLEKPFLDPWRPVLAKYHLITISTTDKGDSDHLSDLPCLDRKSFTMADVNRSLKISSGSGSGSRSAAAQGFAILTSTRRYIAFLDLKSAAPASDPATGEILDPFQQHLINLRSPSTPFFFNTLYDPFRPGTDFVRGYPFSLRTGTPTAVSHGLWMNPKMQQRADLVLTIPRNCFFLARSLNVAFDRELVGAGMFLGAFEDRLRGDLWAGLCVKKICDYLGFGVKSGLPYVVEKEFDQGKEEGNENAEIVGFFEALQLPAGLKSAAECYAEIVQQVKVGKPRFATEGLCLEGLLAWSSAWGKN